jgi:hypothetical protein
MPKPSNGEDRKKGDDDSFIRSSHNLKPFTDDYGTKVLVTCPSMVVCLNCHVKYRFGICMLLSA